MAADGTSSHWGGVSIAGAGVWTALNSSNPTAEVLGRAPLLCRDVGVCVCVL